MLTLSDPLTSIEIDYLNKQLDLTKTRVFLNKNAAFLGSLMCGIDFQWTREIPTAAISSTCLYWNPDFFLYLKPDVRGSVLIHELWHLGFLHQFRQGSRDKDEWNIACDHKINLDMQDEGYSWEGVDSWCCLDRAYKGMVEEDIFEKITKLKPPPTWVPDLIPDNGDGAGKQQAISNVVRALQEAQKAGTAGNLPGNTKVMIETFMTPIIRWEPLFHRFFIELLDGGSTWRRPNRRFTDMYLPSRWQDEGLLANLNYYEDVSGSISDKDNLRFNSELKYVWDELKPKRMNVMQFDDGIRDTRVFNEGDMYEKIQITGRGGTQLEPVRQHIIETRPTAVVIFSDLECEPMASLPFDVPIIWVAIRNRSAVVPFGELIHIN